MKRNRLIGLVVGSVVLSSGLALGQAKLGPYVVDSSGQRIGSLSYSGNGSGAIISLGGFDYQIDAARYGFVTSDIMLFLENADCSGAQYIRVSPFYTLLERAWFTSDGFFHYPAMAPVSFVAGEGSRTINADGSFGPCQPTSWSFLVGPHLSAVAPTLIPPFSVVDAFPVSPAPAQATFNDVPTNHPFFQFIEALKASGITGGCQASPPLYCPDAPLTRGQMAVFLAKALGL